jgi:hypothetical protein
MPVVPPMTTAVLPERLARGEFISFLVLFLVRRSKYRESPTDQKAINAPFEWNIRTANSITPAA